jgi:hypothetical protein
MLSIKASLLSLLPFASAHFNLVYPPARGFDEDKLPTFPCGGQDTVSKDRTTWPVGGPIQLLMGHTSTNVQVLIAMGSDPGDAFNTILVPTFHEDGPQNFCLGAVDFPSNLNITDGMPATIQVVTNGDDGPGGLYNVNMIPDYERCLVTDFVPSVLMSPCQQSLSAPTIS